MIKLTELQAGHQSLEDGNATVFNGNIFSKSIINIYGKNNKLIVDNDAKVVNCNLSFFSDNSIVHVGCRSKLTGEIKMGLSSEIRIGCDVSITGNIKMYAGEKANIFIGNDCMIGSGVTVMTHDSHPIFDAINKERLNKSKNIVIGNHVWIANEVLVMKGVEIMDGAVVGIRSTVLADVPANSVAVGNPARVIREGVKWDRRSLNTTPPLYFDTADF